MCIELIIKINYKYYLRKQPYKQSNKLGGTVFHLSSWQRLIPPAVKGAEKFNIHYY